MKTRKLTLCLLCLFCVTWLACGKNRNEEENKYAKDRKNWLPILKEIYGDKQPSVKPDQSMDNVRELKYPGQRFMHMGIVQINGTGKLVKEHKYWFDSEYTLQLEHQSDFTIAEEIISSEEELDDGIIRSRFTVQSFNEELKSAKEGAKFGFITTNDIFTGLRNFQRNHGASIDELGDRLFNLAQKAALAAAALAVAPEATVTKGAAGGTAATAAVLFGCGCLAKVGNYVIEKIVAKTDDDGNLILDGNDIKKLYPEADKVIKKLHRLEMTTIETTWVAQNGDRKPEEIGYTQLDIVSQNPDITEEDKEMLAKMVYRANPFGVKTILPDDKKGTGNVWEINADDVISWLTTAGISYDTVEGSIHVQDLGSSKSDKYEDEKSLQKKKKITITTLNTITENNDRLRFMKKLKDSSQVKMSLIPTSGEIVVVTPEAEEDAPKYVKTVNVLGRIEQHIDRPTGLLTDIVYEANSVEINYIYTQMRMNSKPSNTENKTERAEQRKEQ